MSDIVGRIAAGLEKLRFRGMQPRAIYLTLADYRAFAKGRTAVWRKETGSKAFCLPYSFDGVPIISEKLIEQMIPVRQSAGKASSTIYSTHGCSVAVPTRLSRRSGLAA